MPTLDQIAEVHGAIRGAAWPNRFGAAGVDMPILYGGFGQSPANAAEIFAVPNVDGALVGGALAQGGRLLWHHRRPRGRLNPTAPIAWPARYRPMRCG